MAQLIKLNGCYQNQREILIIEIPKEFEEHYNNDNFTDSFKRIETDMKFGEKCLSGLYEAELIEMLRNAFYNAVEVK